MRQRVCILLLLLMALSFAIEDPNESPKTTEAKESNETPKSDEAERPKNVLIYNPHMGYYHVQFMTTIANRLRAAGHNVTMLDSLVNPNLQKFEKAKGIHIVEVEQNKITRRIVKDGETSDSGLRAFWDDLSEREQLEGLYSFYKMKGSFSTMMSHQCKQILNSNQTMSKLRNTRFDLAITEVFDFCGLGIFHQLQPNKTILASSVPLHEFIGEILGLPKTFDIVPTKFSMSTHSVHRENYDEFNLIGFIKNAMESAIFGQNMFGYLEANETKIFQEYYANKTFHNETLTFNDKILTFPGIKMLLKNAHSLMENVHPLLDLNNPTLSAIIPIGGITAQHTNTLLTEKNIKRGNNIIADMKMAKSNGQRVVLVSFGTVMNPKNMKNETKRNLVRALEGVDNTIFFWKVKKEFFSKDVVEPKNVKRYNWLPQNYLLASGEVDLFVSHMGIGSMTEAAYSGVPLVAIPIFVDQHYNYVCARRLGIAQFVDKASLVTSPDNLKDAIRNALVNKTMKAKSIQLKKNLEAFGNQTEKMMNHINFILSIGNQSTLPFEHHHHGFSLWLSLRSLVHLLPQYAVPITIIFLFILGGTFVHIVYIAIRTSCYREQVGFGWSDLWGLIETTWLPLSCYYLFFAAVYPFLLYCIDYFVKSTSAYRGIILVALIVGLIPFICFRYVRFEFIKCVRWILSILSILHHYIMMFSWKLLNIIFAFSLVLVGIYWELFFPYGHNW